MARRDIRLGWRRDTPDSRDHFAAIQPAAGLPISVDKRAQFPAPYDQGQLGSCTGNAIAGVLESDQIRQKLKFEFTPSRLFIYYGERAAEGTINEDAGAEIRDGIKVVNSLGVCPESDWPYDISKFAVKPAAVAYQDAKFHKALKYARVPVSAQAIKTVLASGYPIVFGFTVYSSFMGDQTAASGIMPMPTSSESVDGGHAVAFAGYQDQPWTDAATGRQMPAGFIVRNSWGTGWGLGGYFVMPYTYADQNLMSDLWQIGVVS